METSAIKHAATIIVLRGDPAAPSVLMGQRGEAAAFMPNKFVFPGGAVDPGDESTPVTMPPLPCTARLAKDARGVSAHALVAAALRELFEETGLTADATALRYVFRAITPPGRPRRFDARFFTLPAGAIADDLDDFSRASGELSHLAWMPIAEMRRFDLPFVTEVVLAEIAARDANAVQAPNHVPFFDNTHEPGIIHAL
ncbi:MAG: NUDIX hydrolase [Pseudomonadota bacterium]